MDKNEVCGRINAVMKTLDNIEVRGAQNAGNIAGCFSILDEVLQYLSCCDIKLEEKDNKVDK